MNNSHKLVHCRRCKDITAHEHLDVFKVRCLRCGSVKDLKNSYVEAEIVIQGKPEDA